VSEGRLERWRRGWPPGDPVAQFPNTPLLIALAAGLVRIPLDGRAADAASAVLYVFLGVWAWLELTDGANLFRRALGAGGLAYVLWRVADGLG
jgi:hypothetical protein